jgi:RNase adaptor protein for sRNA GlmZ degradation
MRHVFTTREKVLLVILAVLVIAVGCTGGRHRSTAVAHHLATFIGEQGFPVSESHRDISR